MGEPTANGYGNRCCPLRWTVGRFQSASCRSFFRRRQSLRPARGSWTAWFGHRHRPHEPGTTRRHPGVPGHSRMEISPTNRLRGHDSRPIRGSFVGASGQRTARNRDMAPKNSESRWTPGSGRPHPNARASTISTLCRTLTHINRSPYQPRQGGTRSHVLYHRSLNKFDALF